jgi:spore germination cell wall hydrolase CwlJ-like protein
MSNMFRVAGVAAAAAFLCASPNAAAQVAPISPAAHAAAATPVTTVTETPALNARQAVLTTATPVVDHSTADTALTPGRTRPDRLEPAQAAPTATRSQGVAARAGETRPLAELVVQHARSETTDEQFECLARAVYFESRGEPLEGQLAVAEVILNRVASGRFRGTICDVVKQPSQFSFVRRGVIPDVPRESAVWRRSVAIAHIALQNLADVTGDDSLFFHATYVNPGWGRPRIARIGNHIFYR